jgi:hypothetical protein
MTPPSGTKSHISLAATGHEPDHRSVLDVWHRVQVGNVINDILFSNPDLAAWGATRGAHQMSPLEEFMDSRSVDRVRLASAYEDSVQVMADIASDRGVRSDFDRWIQRGVLPESCMYVMYGSPERLVFPRSPDYPPDSV